MAARGISSRNQNSLPVAPPPPTLSHPRPTHSNSRHDLPRARSRSPINRHISNRFVNERDRDRDRGRPSRRRSPDSYNRTSSLSKPPSGMVPQSTGNTYPLESKIVHSPSVSRVATISDRENIVRRILAPENVAIPRRAGEGARPIFDREELRESIKRRMESGDNDVNPALPEQRVVAIIREPMLPEHYLVSRSSIQTAQLSLSSEIPERQKTSTGMSYRLKPTSSIGLPPTNRSRSVEKPVHNREYDRTIRNSRGTACSQNNYGRSFSRFDEISRPKLESRDRRRTRSRSVTPPPMPPEMQRNLVSRNRGGFGEHSRGFRLFENEHDSRLYRGRGIRGFRRPRGSFQPRGFGRARGRSPGNWEHDMYDRDRAGEESLDSKRNTSK